MKILKLFGYRAILYKLDKTKRRHDTCQKMVDELKRKYS